MVFSSQLFHAGGMIVGILREKVIIFLILPDRESFRPVKSTNS